MDQAVPVWGILVGAGVLCVVAAVAVGGLVRGQQRLRAEVAELRSRPLDPLMRRVSPEPAALRSRHQSSPQTSGPVLLPDLPGAADFVITTAGTEQDEPLEPVPASRFVSLAAGESLIRLVSIGHGLRRALSAENRNRIAFEIRREVRRSRKHRRRQLKQVRRGLRSAGRQDAA